MNPKSQIETDQTIINFLGDRKIESSEDLIKLREYILDSLQFKPYNEETKEQADSIQWKRTASQIIKDGYVYEGKACSDIAVVFLALCKALNIEGNLLKLITIDKTNTHTIIEVKLNDTWYRLDPSKETSIPHQKEMTEDDIFRGKYQLWKRGKDNWDLGLDSFESEKNIFNN